jgi:murein DD-endopeptidase MepM/ murein hydrolase activator NlpD
VARVAARAVLVLATCSGLVPSVGCRDATAPVAAADGTSTDPGSSGATVHGSSGDDLDPTGSPADDASDSTGTRMDTGEGTTGAVEPCEAGTYPNAGKCVDRILFALPMENEDGSLISDVVGVDNDPEVGRSDLDCVSHEGSPFPSCYDDHDGTDFILAGGFATMDDGSAGVFAAAEGEVVLVHDGEFDRCALDIAAASVVCEDGGPVTPANRITIQHADGTSTRYLHLMKDSILVAEGDHVACGQLLARVGSSGNSSMPHLHFSVHDVDGNAVDPYAGPGSQPETLWALQDGAHGLPGAACQ